MNRLPRIARRPMLVLAVLATAALCLGAATVGASEVPKSPIVAIWSFNGGQIGVERLSDGTYVGIVVAATTFAECPHPVGEQIWSGITEQKDGSFWGWHQWFKYGEECERNPQLGPTAWRVLQEPSGERFMRVCFSHPGTSQPKIAPDGTSKEATYGCADSKRIASIPVPGSSPGGGGSGSGATGSGNSGGGSSGGGGNSGGGSSGGEKGPLPTIETLSLPNTKKCLSAKLFTIRLKDPQYDPFKTVTIVFKGHKLKTVRHGAYVTATINLAGVHGTSFTVKVNTTTVLGHTLSATPRYHRCHKHKAGKGHKKG